MLIHYEITLVSFFYTKTAAEEPYSRRPQLISFLSLRVYLFCLPFCDSRVPIWHVRLFERNSQVTSHPGIFNSLAILDIVSVLPRVSNCVVLIVSSR